MKSGVDRLVRSEHRGWLCMKSIALRLFNQIPLRVLELMALVVRVVLEPL